jgi:hypothetical protein
LKINLTLHKSKEMKKLVWSELKGLTNFGAAILSFMTDPLKKRIIIFYSG